MAQEIDHDPEFNWWINVVLKKRLQIISLVKNRNDRYIKKTHNFIIEVPNSVAREYAMDENNGNTLFAYAIAKEMNYVSPAFSKLYHEEIVTIGY